MPMSDVEYRPHNLDEERVANLRKLADYLSALPADGPTKFDMYAFFKDESEYLDPVDAKQAINHCGTVACAIGHGPAAGIKPAEDCNDWLDYAKDMFIGHGAPSANAYLWLFGSDWTEIDNTPQGAAKRIYHMLEYGVPVNFQSYRSEDLDTYYENVHDPRTQQSRN